MSSSRTAIMAAIRRRLAFSVVVAVVAIVVGVIVGNSVVAVVLITAALLIGFGAITSRRGADKKQEPRGQRAKGEPFSLTYQWRGEDEAGSLALTKALEEQGMKPIDGDSAHQVVLVRGSNARARLFGAHFIRFKHVPIRVELCSTDDHPDQSSVTLVIQDRFGLAIRDEALGDRFRQVAEDLCEGVESQVPHAGRFSELSSEISGNHCNGS